MVIFFLSYCLLFNKITLNKGNVGTNHLNNRILLFVCNRKVIYYYYITLPSITITITITFGNFQSITITITITGKSGYYYYNYILHITITPSLVWKSIYVSYFVYKMHTHFVLLVAINKDEQKPQMTGKGFSETNTFFHIN